MADLERLWREIEEIIEEVDAKRSNLDVLSELFPTAEPYMRAAAGQCEHPCMHGTLTTGPTCCVCGQPIN